MEKANRNHGDINNMGTIEILIGIGMMIIESAINWIKKLFLFIKKHIS